MINAFSTQISSNITKWSFPFSIRKRNHQAWSVQSVIGKVSHNFASIYFIKMADFHWTLLALNFDLISKCTQRRFCSIPNSSRGCDSNKTRKAPRRQKHRSNKIYATVVVQHERYWEVLPLWSHSCSMQIVMVGSDRSGLWPIFMDGSAFSVKLLLYDLTRGVGNGS